MPIRILDAETISRIAAGEVVERPASIAKEMIENAIDAGSTSITIEIRDGGIEYMRVTDNGCGIPAEETRFAFTNHATSKIVSGDQLSDIRTLGFRGEALASIAAVSKVEMRTRTRGAESGALVKVEGGAFLGVQDIGCPEGTSITVRDLFYNVPARKAFLRKTSYEAGVVHDTVTRLMLGNPGVAIRLINNGKTVAHSYGDGKLRSAALSVLGRDIASKMQEIDVSEGSFRLTGLIGIGDLARQNRSMQYFFINGRSIRCNLLTYALEQAAKERIGIGMHPICALHVRIPASAVDVNVHPNKLEVRFRDEQGFRITAESLLRQALAKDNMLDISALIEEKQQAERVKTAPEPSRSVLEMTTAEKLSKAKELSGKEQAQIIEDDRLFTSLRKSMFSSSVVRESGSNFFGLSPDAASPLNSKQKENTPSNEVVSTVDRAGPAAIQTAVCYNTDNRPSNQTTVCNKQTDAAPIQTEFSSADAINQPLLAKDIEQISMQQLEPAKKKPEYRIIGVVMRTYLILEVDDAMVLIDQHAAHERLLYEQYKKRLDLGTASQRLLAPILLQVTPKELALIEENDQTIKDAGYEIEPFGTREVRINAVPYVLGKADHKLMIGSMLETLSDLKGAQIEQRLQEVIKLSCRKAIKGGDSLTQTEIEALVEEMLESGAPPTCPHGRPVARVITRSELEKMFWRT